MSKTIEIVDRGRGLQLSTSRITVQDLVPYFQRGDSYEEILRWIPIVTREEIAVVERYYQEHKEELDEQDRRIRARTEERVRQQRLRFPEPEGTPEERLARLKQRHQERNGDAGLWVALVAGVPTGLGGAALGRFVAGAGQKGVEHARTR